MRLRKDDKLDIESVDCLSDPHSRRSACTDSDTPIVRYVPRLAAFKKVSDKVSGQSADSKTHRAEISGTTKKYFKIWIVNVVATIVTLGIYGARASVRCPTCCRNNTKIDEYAFGYHATGQQVLIRRIAVVFHRLLSNDDLSKYGQRHHGQIVEVV